MQHDARNNETPKPGRRLPRGKRDALPGCVRSCAACRTRAPRGELLRFALVDGKVVFDLERRIRGRGLNLGPSPVCIERAQKRGAFQRTWRIGVSPEDARVLAAEVGLRLRERLTSWLEQAFARGALARAGSIDQVEPASVQVLWRESELAAVVGAVPPSSPRTPRAAAKMAALAHAARQFTLVGAGDMKRRPEPVDLCPALAPETGRGRAAQVGVESATRHSAGGRAEARPPAEGVRQGGAADPANAIMAVARSTADGSGRTPLEVEAGVSPRRPSGGSE
ncbi:MAG: YlxR family protein [Myxococcota bacterium]